MNYVLVALLSIVLSSSFGYAEERLVIISPHRKSMQNEVIPKFQEHYKKSYGKDITVEWIDQGGTENDLRFIKSKFAKSPKTSDMDVLWGGGDLAGLELDSEKLLEVYKVPAELSKELPTDLAGHKISLRSSSGTWFAAALSGFGLFYNKKRYKMMKLQEPRTWEDLADPKLFNFVSVADLRQSGSSMLMNLVVLDSLGWKEGWRVLTAVAGNTNRFTHSSSDPIKAVVSGDAMVATSVDFYAQPKVTELGSENLGFVLPEGKTIINADPVMILKGAPNLLQAQRFMAYVLGAESQKILFLPKGAPGGPVHESLARMGVNSRAYQETSGQALLALNPFVDLPKIKSIDFKRLHEIREVFSDLVGAIHIDTHRDLKAAWLRIQKSGMDSKLVAEISTPPITEAQLTQLAAKWGDSLFRAKTINEWTKWAQVKYTRLAGVSS